LFPFFAACPEKLFFKRKNGKKESPKRPARDAAAQRKRNKCRRLEKLGNYSFYHYAVLLAAGLAPPQRG